MKAGLYSAAQVSMEAYTQDKLGDQPTLSAGLAQTLLTRSPLHAKWSHPRLSPDYETQEKTVYDIGTSAHALLLEGSDKCIAWMHYDDYRKKEAQEAKAAARLQGLTPVLAKYQKPLGDMVEAAKAYISKTELAGIFDNGEPEITGLWDERGVWCRMRIDWLSKDRRVMLNYKTARSAQPDQFIRAMPGLGYDLSAVFYERGMKMLGHDAQEFFFAQEITPPYACSLVGLSPALRDIAERKRDFAMTLWAGCLKDNKWNGYPSRICYAEPTPWQLAQHEEDMAFNDRMELLDA